ncbi:helix-turn-helix domain-containing protein [Actinokineospora iranica]|uniref:AraC-type DNA-binding protein n=1 Tax=Actinokineospora iranica TaxID=1271860 RepID=A0A1G6JZF2_9PSEU|nr:helix-turn-helix domain-containing protein [Actinokineospora iranica]SDC24162.1 AraC-type DNA-binding protein [Actinokineospora iranica]
MIENQFRTDDVPAAERFEYWRAHAARTIMLAEVSSDHADDFLAVERDLRLGSLVVFGKEHQPMTARRTAALIRRADPEVYQLSLPLSGRADISWTSREASLGPGEFHVSDSSQPHVVRLRTGGKPFAAVGVRVPKSLVAVPQAQVERVIGRPMPASAGIGALLAGFLTDLDAQRAACHAGDGPRLGTVVADLVSALFAEALDLGVAPQAHGHALVPRVEAFIREHLADPGLTPGAIAAAHHISVSYLHRLFQADGRTVGGWIRRERLENARRDLADPVLAAVAVQDIAARWGFTRHSVFTRAFRAAYGTSPTDYRNQSQPPRRVVAWPGRR